MNSESILFNHEEFGEAFIGMAAHTSKLPQLDRMILEDCVFNGDPLGGGKVLAPHINVKDSPSYHLKPEAIQKQIQQAGIICTFYQAKTLSDCWIIIEATPKMIKTFILWIKIKGTDKAVAYFEHLATELAEVEVCEDEFIAQDDADPEENDHTDIYKYHPIGCDISTCALCQECFTVYDLRDHDWKDTETEIICCDCCGNSFTAYKFEPVATWESVQPGQYQRLLANIRTIKNLDQLKAIGKEIFESNKLDHGQSGVFWYEYGKTKERIFQEVRTNLGASAKTLMRQIHHKRSKELSAFGILLYKIQSGKVKMTDTPSENEWTLIWETYKFHKAE